MEPKAADVLKLILSEIDSSRASGEVDIRSLRFYVSSVLSMVNAGASFEDILKELGSD